MSNVLIRLNNVSKSFMTDGQPNHIIKNLNLEIKKGEFTVIMGASGSGKSTIMYLLSGMDKVTSGDVVFEDKKLNTLSDKKMADFRRDKIGFIFQGINLIPHLSLVQNIVVAGYLKKKNRKEVYERAKNLLKSVDLEKETNKLPSQVSGGQSQRGAIVRALINEPEVIFADEPTGALNSKNGQEVLDLLSELRDKNQSIVMVTHDIKGALRGDRILFIKDGNLEGELQLGQYSKQQASQREKTVVSYLNEKGW